MCVLGVQHCCRFGLRRRPGGDVLIGGIAEVRRET